MAREKRAFTSRLSRGETVAVLVLLPLHELLLPLALLPLVWRGQLSQLQANVAVYLVGCLYLFLFLRGFFRRDFDALCDRPLRCLGEIAAGFGLILLGNILVGELLRLVPDAAAGNPNNTAVEQMLDQSFGPVAAMALLMAPVVEECLFRAGFFGLLRRRSRTLAYLVSTLLFALYHVWGYAAGDPRQLWYLLQYLPAGLLLARCYERTDSIWGSLLLHMLNNGVAVWAARLAGG